MDCRKLADFLEEKNDNVIKLSIDELKNILTPEWTSSLSKWPAAWQENGHPYVRAWTSKGWKASPKKDGDKITYVIFRKYNDDYTETINIKNKESRIKKIVEIPTPCINEIKSYLHAWDNLGSYVIQEAALDKLFFRTYPNNTDIHDVLIKVASLNDFYSTNIFKPFAVAEHIVSLNIDNELELANPELVNRIANVDISGKHKNFYSFATKYCSRHKPCDYPIYDNYVEKILIYFRDIDNFYDFTKQDLKDYPCYKNIVIKFRAFYKLDDYTLKEIDKYLWQLGKKYFPKDYS